MNQTDSLSGDTNPGRRLFLYAMVGIAVVVGIVIALVRPSMPDRVVLLTGPENGFYHEFGLNLAKELESRGLKVDIVVTKGSLDNRLRLVDQETEKSNLVALSSSIVKEQKPVVRQRDLASLGSVSIEPLWLFYRSDASIETISDLEGKRVATEGTHTASGKVFTGLINQLGLSSSVTQVEYPHRTALEAIKGFQSGQIDAVLLSGPPKSSSIQSLIRYDKANLLSLDRGDAIAKRIPGATLVLASEGVFDLARNIPRQDTTLLAGATCLIANRGLHPALVPVLLAGVEQAHQESHDLVSSETFPSSQHVPIPLAATARRYYQQGEVGLSKMLPYRAVRFLNHLGFFVLPLVSVAVLLLKAVPLTLKTVCNFKLKQWFRQLEGIEKSFALGADPDTLLNDLDEIDQKSAILFVPRSVSHDYVDFRQFVHDMRDRIYASQSSCDQEQ